MAEQILKGKLTKPEIDAFLALPSMARLATAVPSKADSNFFQPHNVPVWFHWDGNNLYISAFQSTRKLKEVQQNPYIAVIVDLPEAIDGAQAVLMEGKAEVVLSSQTVQDMSRVIYAKYMGPEGVKAPEPQSWIVDPENAIIKLTPARIYTW